MTTLQKQKTKAFTILEFLLALFLSTLLVLTVYQVYGHVLDTYRRQKEDLSLKYLQISESLARQLTARLCDPVYQNRPLLSYEDDLFAFLTRFGPGGARLILYGPHPREERQTAYLELPYTGQKLPRSLEELFDEYKDLLLSLPPLQFKFYKVKEPGEEVELEKLSEAKGLICLEVSGRQGFSRKIYFSSCPKEGNK